MSRRGRIAGFSFCAVLVAVGLVCAVVVPGGTGQVLVLVFVSVGLTCATSLVFMDIGLGEERERAREQAAARRRELARRERMARPRGFRLGRARDHPRRLD